MYQVIISIQILFVVNTGGESFESRYWPENNLTETSSFDHVTFSMYFFLMNYRFTSNSFNRTDSKVPYSWHLYNAENCA